MRALACLRQSLNGAKSLLSLLIEEIVLARLKAASEKVQYSSITNCTIDAEDDLDTLAAMMTLIGVLVSSVGSSLNVKSLLQGQLKQGFLSQLGPDCQAESNPISMRLDSLLVQISAIFSEEAT